MDVQLTDTEQQGIGTHLRLWKSGGEDYIHGLVHGEEMPEATVVTDNEDVVILKVPGRSYWYQNPGSRGYAGAEFRVYLRLREEVDGRDILVRLLASYPVSKPRGASK